MSVLWKAFDLLWKMTEKSDEKTHADQVEAEGIERVCDIPYIDDSDKYHLLDVYYPEKRDGNLPVIIDIHGGGWMYGDKELNKFYNLELAARGFTVFNVSYRLCPNVTVEEQIRDVMQALRWIQENMSNYPADCKNIMLTGDSAGGMLAGYAAALLGSAQLREIFGTVDAGMKLTALMLTSPVAYMDKPSVVGIYTKMMWENSGKGKMKDYLNINSLLPYTTMPPTLLMTSSGDFLAEAQTRELTADMKKLHMPCKLIDYPKFEGKDLPHVFAVLRPAEKAGVNAITETVNYYKKVMSLKK